MGGTLVLHDLPPDAVGAKGEGVTFFAAKPCVDPCVGCFGCWVRTPGKCVIADRGDALAGLMARCEQLVIVSRLVFGGLSAETKAVLDRSIGYVLPFFRIVEGEMHHAMRYDARLTLRYLLYGATISAHEEETARSLIAFNARNLGADAHRIAFFATGSEAMEAIA